MVIDPFFEHYIFSSSVCCWYAHHVIHDEIYWSLSIRCEENYIRQRTNYDKRQLHELALETSKKFFPLIQQLVQRTPVDQMQDCLLFKDLEPIQQHSSGRYWFVYSIEIFHSFFVLVSRNLEESH